MSLGVVQIIIIQLALEILSYITNYVQRVLQFAWSGGEEWFLGGGGGLGAEKEVLLSLILFIIYFVLLLLLSITFPAQTLIWLDQFPVLDLGFILWATQENKVAALWNMMEKAGCHCCCNCC